jgi:hypothetical protein
MVARMAASYMLARTAASYMLARMAASYMLARMAASYMVARMAASYTVPMSVTMQIHSTLTERTNIHERESIQQGKLSINGRQGRHL